MQALLYISLHDGWQYIKNTETQQRYSQLKRGSNIKFDISLMHATWQRDKNPG